MTSLKRSFDSSQTTLSNQPSQQSWGASPLSSQDQPSYSDCGWESIFSELIGVNLGNDEFQGLGTDEPSYAPVVGDTGIESGTSLELGLGAYDEYGSASAADWICYGMIYLTKVKLTGNMTDVQRALHSPDVPRTNSGTHFLLGVVAENDHLFVNIQPGLHLAQLNRHLAESLENLVVSKAIELQAIVHKRTLFDDIGFATRATDAQTTININVYGPAASSHANGRHLSACKVWLQRPDWHRPGCVYDNPHVIKTESAPNEIPQALNEGVSKESETETLQNSIQEVYSMLTRDAHLSTNASGDPRLQTSLLPHQAKALDFMIQRENGPIPEQFELWESVVQNGQTWYQHKVAGIKSRMRPTETGGGVLADEMGMGKTFSMLSLLVNSLDAAAKWATDPETYLTDNIIPSKKLSRATLVVVPSPLLLATWTDEIETRLKVRLQVYTHHGRDRATDAEELMNNDVVLTTYHTLIADHNKQYSPVAGIAWYRIILDEAHFIRSPTTYLHKRVAELDAKFRWCLTGTPIQNRLDDIGALFAFLRIFPFDRLNIFRQCVSVPFKDGGKMKHVARRNLAKLLDAFCIRRMKVLLNLAKFNEKTRLVSFSTEEKEQYDKTYEDMKRAMGHTINESMNSKRFGIFQAQLQLRLLCNHGTFQHQFHWARARNLLDEREDALTWSSLDWSNGEGACSSCHQLIPTIDLDAACKLQDRCTHMLCQECRQGIGGQCPLCQVTALGQRGQKHGGSSRMQQAREAYFQHTGHSSKMNALIQELRESDPQDKCIVFSHWTTTLDLVGRHLRDHGMDFERIDGNDELTHRKRTLSKFKNDGRLKILIMTTGVGAFGLDLIAANRVHLVEPQWNPSIELQAVGRTLRIGQQKEVMVTRYIVKDSVEQKIQHMQQRKLGMAGMATKMGEVDLESVSRVKNEFQPHFDSIFK